MWILCFSRAVQKVLRVFGMTVWTAATTGHRMLSKLGADVREVCFMTIVISSGVTSRNVSVMFFFLVF